MPLCLLCYICRNSVADTPPSLHRPTPPSRTGNSPSGGLIMNSSCPSSRNTTPTTCSTPGMRSAARIGRLRRRLACRHKMASFVEYELSKFAFIVNFSCNYFQSPRAQPCNALHSCAPTLAMYIFKELLPVVTVRGFSARVESRRLESQFTLVLCDDCDCVDSRA